MFNENIILDWIKYPKELITNKMQIDRYYILCNSSYTLYNICLKNDLILKTIVLKTLKAKNIPLYIIKKM